MAIISQFLLCPLDLLVEFQDEDPLKLNRKVVAKCSLAKAMSTKSLKRYKI